MDEITYGKAIAAATAKFNRVLGIIQKEMGTTKHLSSHVQRKSLGRNLRLSGVYLEDIQDILNHKDVKTTLEFTLGI